MDSCITSRMDISKGNTSKLAGLNGCIVARQPSPSPDEGGVLWPPRPVGYFLPTGCDFTMQSKGYMDF